MIDNRRKIKMTLRHYKIFIAVCDSMNMTDAAEALFMSQSAVSQAIAEMEKFFGVRLFERLSRRLYLTPAGQKLLNYARQIIRMNAQAESEMKAANRSAPLRIGASVTVGGYVLPELVARFQKANPETEIEVFEDNTEKVESRILQDKIDLGLVEGDTVSPDLLSFDFMEDELALVCGSSHRFAGLPAVEGRELERENFIIRERGSGTRKTFEDVLSANHLHWKAGWVCNNADTIKNAVARGLGITVISKRSVQSEILTGSLCAVPVDKISFQRTFKITHHKNKFISASLRDFMDLCIRFGQEG
jgi:Transcriptional regulator